MSNPSLKREVYKLEIQERLLKLLVDGIQREATSPNIDISKRPNYFDANRLKRSQKTCQKYYTNISFGSSNGLILILQLESILVPLLSTGKSRTVPDLFDRYTATAKYIRSFYETNFWEPQSEGWRNLQIIRGMHRRIHKLMKDKEISGAAKVWVNQYDMSITQFAFIGLFLLKPAKCGAHKVSREELADVVYYWHILSYYFGIEEEYNLFVYDSSEQLDGQLELLNVVLDHMRNLLDSKPRHPAGLRMAEGYMLAFEDLSTETTLNILDHWWSPYISLTGRKELQPYSFSERWKLLFFLLYFEILFRSDTLLGYINNMYKRKFDKFYASGEKVKRKLAKKYKDHICEL